MSILRMNNLAAF